MSRRHYVPEGMIEYHGQNIGLTADGRLACQALGIVADSLDEVKKLIRAREEKRKKLNKIDVWFKERYGSAAYIKGTTTALGVGYRGQDVWVTWRGYRGNEKQMIGAEGVYIDTESNREIIDQINKLHQQIATFQKQIATLTEQLVPVTPIDEP